MDTTTTSNIGKWSKDEQAKYESAIKQFGQKWKLIASFVGSRTSV